MFQDMQTRRLFLQKGLTLMAVTPTIPTFLDNTVLALAQPTDTKRTQQLSGKDGKILVVVQLSGGNDGLNTVVPYADDAYHRARPNLKVEAKDVLKVDNYMGLHPNLAPLKNLFDDGMAAIINGVGYPNPNRSHFRSMDIWHSAQPERENPTSGWLGRYFDNTCNGEDPHNGVAIGETAPLAVRGDKLSALSFERPENYRYNGRDRQRYEALNKPDENGTSPSTQPARIVPAKQKVEPVTAESQLGFLERTALDAQLSSDKILSLVRAHNPQGYPGGEFGNGLRTIAAMIKGNLPTRVYYVSLGGFDTHANQRGRHDNLMQQFAQGVQAFWNDMKQQENDKRVVMLTFSEFGRRVEQNASQGTDHGAAAPMFVFGRAVKPGLYGKYPSLTKLDQGDLIYNTDFRSVYATVLQEWLDAPSKPILGSQFPTIPLLKT